MYETDDWDFGEDYLKDFENIDASFDENDRTNVKKRKIDDVSFFSSTLISQDNVRITTNTENIEKRDIKRNKVLKLFEETCVYNNTQPELQSDKKKEVQNSKLQSRRQRVAELFKNENSESNVQSKNKGIRKQDISKSQPNNEIPSKSKIVFQSQLSNSSKQFENNESNSSSLKFNSDLKFSERPFNKKSTVLKQNPSLDVNKSGSTTYVPKSRTSKDTTFEPQPGTSRDSDPWLTPTKEVPKSREKTILEEQNNPKPSVSRFNDRRKLVLDCFKKSSDSPLQKRTLVRKFPGPAGLLPVEDSSTMLNFMDSDSLNEDLTSTFDTTTFCSQQTKNLFTEGAWQLMTDDLPDGFMKGHDIASIKKKTKQKKLKNNKAPFMAGIVQSIDYGSDNPKIVLKDFSGEIECCIHCNIINKYPNTLDYGIVLLLKNIGIISSKNYFYAMVSLNSIVSIYTHKERIVSTPNLKMIHSMTDDCLEDINNISRKEESLMRNYKHDDVQENDSNIFETIEKTDSFELSDDFFKDETVIDKENKISKVLSSQNVSSSFDWNASVNSKAVRDSNEPVCNFNENSSKVLNTVEYKNTQNGPVSTIKNNSEHKVDTFFDADDEAFFAVDEHISQVEQSFFASPPAKIQKLDAFKSSKNNLRKEEMLNRPEKPMIVDVQVVEKNPELNQTIKDLKKFAFQKKVPSTLFCPTNATSADITSMEIDEPNSLEDHTKKEHISEPRSDVNVNSAKFKLMQFKRQVDISPPENTPIGTKEQFNCSEDLFSCDDDLLMSQMELDSL